MNPIPNKASADSRPHLRCRIVRQWCMISSGNPPAHVESCPSCQGYFQTMHAFDTALRRDALRSSQAAAVSSRDFERNIIRAVRTSASKQPRRHSQPAMRAWVMGGVGALAAVAAVLLSLNPDLIRSQRNDRVAGSPGDDAAVILSTVESLSSDLVESVIPTAGVFVADNPLQRELGSVYSDVRSALDFLALNFLPATRVAPTPQPTRQI